MKLLFVIIFTSAAIASDCVLEYQPLKISSDPATGLKSKACNDGKGSSEIRAMLTKKAAKKSCETCIDPYGDFVRQTVNGRKERQKKYAKTALEEFKKNLGDISIDLMKIRSQHNLNLPKDIANNCSLDRLKSESCKKAFGESAINEIQKELANELRNILQPPPPVSPSLLARPASSSCNISDNDIATIQTNLIEHTIDSRVIKDIKRRLSQNEVSFDDLRNGSGELVDINIFKDHPALKNIFKDIESVKSFFANIPEESSPEEFLAKAYATSGNSLGADIEKRCNSSFELLEQKICNDNQFQEGNLFVDDANMIFNSINDSDVEVQDQLIKDFCFELKHSGNETKRFSELKQELQRDIDDRYKELPFSLYREKVYLDYFSKPRELICNSQNKCKDKIDLDCKLSNIWDSIKKQRLEDKKNNKKSFADQSVNNILAAMVGDPKGLDPEVRKVLVAERIIQDGTVPEPKHDPSHDPTPSNIARDPVYKAANPNFKSTTVSSNETNKTSSQPQKAAVDSTFISQQSMIAPKHEDQETRSPQNDQERTVAGEQTVQQALKDPFNQQLIDRLMKGRKQPTFTRDEVNKIVREQLAAQKATFPTLPQATQQSMVDEATDKFYNDAFNSNFGPAAASFKATGRTNITRDKLTGYDRALAESLQKKYLADEAAGKPEGKSSTLGQKKEVPIEVGSPFQIEAKLKEQITEQLIQNVGDVFTLTIRSGLEVFEFDVRQLVASPKPGKKIPDDVIRKVTEFFAKIPRERQQKLRFLNAILSANNT